MTYLQYLIDGPNISYRITDELFDFLRQKCKNTNTEQPKIHALNTDYSRRVLFISSRRDNFDRIEIYKTSFKNIFTINLMSYKGKSWSTYHQVTLPEELQFVILMAAK